MAEKLILFHGTTSFRTLGAILNQQDLIGYRHGGKPEFSGSLTNDKTFANVRANIACTMDGRGTAVILQFGIPNDELIDEGPIGNHPPHVRGFSTTHAVDPNELPEAFVKVFQTIHREVRPYIKREGISFHRIPIKYLQEVHTPH